MHKQARSKSEDEVQAFINGTGTRGGPPIKAEVSYLHGRKSYMEHIEQQGLDTEAEGVSGSLRYTLWTGRSSRPVLSPCESKVQ